MRAARLWQGSSQVEGRDSVVGDLAGDRGRRDALRLRPRGECCTTPVSTTGRAGRAVGRAAVKRCPWSGEPADATAQSRSSMCWLTADLKAVVHADSNLAPHSSPRGRTERERYQPTSLDPSPGSRPGRHLNWPRSSSLVDLRKGGVNADDHKIMWTNGSFSHTAILSSSLGGLKIALMLLERLADFMIRTDRLLAQYPLPVVLVLGSRW